MISTSRVPDITVYDKYGKAKYKNDDIVIFKDYVYNVTKGMAYPRIHGKPFYFIDGINGITVEHKKAPIDSMLDNKSPKMG
jgi:hypothetical protein